MNTKLSINSELTLMIPSSGDTSLFTVDFYWDDFDNWNDCVDRGYWDDCDEKEELG